MEMGGDFFAFCLDGVSAWVSVAGGEGEGKLGLFVIDFYFLRMTIAKFNR